MNLTDDIADRLDRDLFTLTGLLGGGDLYGRLLGLVRPAAEVLAAELEGQDRRVAAQTAIDLASLIDLDDIDDAVSPLGLACMLTFEHKDISQARAARLLGVTPQRVTALLDKGRLERCGTAVNATSVARLIAERGRQDRQA
jgi:hypothetical protein